jgi:transcriptional regulator with XRE-family HTH domain
LSPRKIGTTVKTLRAQRGLTQVELAKRAKVGQAYIAMLERGARKNPSLPVLKRLARALGVPVGELLE